MTQQKEEFDELVAEIKKLKGVVLRQEKKMETLESRINEFDSLIKEATTFKLGDESLHEDSPYIDNLTLDCWSISCWLPLAPICYLNC